MGFLVDLTQLLAPWLEFVGSGLVWTVLVVAIWWVLKKGLED